MKIVLKNNMMAIVAGMLLIGFSAFKVAERSITENLSNLIYFPHDVNGNLISLDPSSTEANPLPYESNPYSCPTIGLKICSQGFNPNDVEVVGGMLVPKSGAIAEEEYRWNP